MKEIKIYHGSKNIVNTPTYGLGKKHNDYGLGFYCTENIELVKEWASNENSDGYINEYSLNLDGLNILDLSSKDYNTLHWITILVKNRIFNLKNEISKVGKSYLIDNYSIDLSKVDIIKGYRADDSYFSYAQAFLNNTISIQMLSEALKYGKLGEQIVLVSKRAFANIKFINSEKVDSSMYYPLREKRNDIARIEYINSISKPFSKDSIYLSDIIKGGK